MAVSYSGNVFKYNADECVRADNKEQGRRLGEWDGMIWGHEHEPRVRAEVQE
jgi:hypothetical protein